MSDGQRTPENGSTMQKPSADQAGVDLDALTAAVERLLRRELEIERERLHGTRRH
jgi:hypothetical protein